MSAQDRPIEYCAGLNLSNTSVLMCLRFECTTVFHLEGGGGAMAHPPQTL